MEPTENQDSKPAGRADAIAAVVTAIILVATTAWLVILLF